VKKNHEQEPEKENTIDHSISNSWNCRLQRAGDAVMEQYTAIRTACRGYHILAGGRFAVTGKVVIWFQGQASHGWWLPGAAYEVAEQI